MINRLNSYQLRSHVLYQPSMLIQGCNNPCGVHGQAKPWTMPSTQLLGTQSIWPQAWSRARDHSYNVQASDSLKNQTEAMRFGSKSLTKTLSEMSGWNYVWLHWFYWWLGIMCVNSHPCAVSEHTELHNEFRRSVPLLLVKSQVILQYFSWYLHTAVAHQA